MKLGPVFYVALVVGCFIGGWIGTSVGHAMAMRGCDMRAAGLVIPHRLVHADFAGTECQVQTRAGWISIENLRVVP